jgi:histidinol-phosphate aminotransferase
LAVQAVIKAMPDIHRYVDPRAHDLIQTASTHYQLDHEQIMTGAGTDALISYVVKAFTEEGDEVLTADGTFIGIYVNVRKHNRLLKRVPLLNSHYDLDAMADAITPVTRIVYLANANNPTGTIFSRDEFESFMERVPEDVLVILDEAYYHYSAHLKNYPDGLNYVRAGKYPNLLVMRTMSKDYGLAGFRIGFVFGAPEIIRELFKVKLPFEPSLPGQVAGRAAFDDTEFLDQVISLNRRMLPVMTAKFASLGIEQVPASANFVLLNFPTEQFARDLVVGCMERGLILRQVGAFGLPKSVRINTGTEEETSFALSIFAETYEQVRLRHAVPEAV